ncbi:MAG: hypothetical protein AAFR65_14210 [Pseudomonadota bacterium]
MLVDAGIILAVMLVAFFAAPIIGVLLGWVIFFPIQMLIIGLMWIPAFSLNLLGMNLNPDRHGYFLFEKDANFIGQKHYMRPWLRKLCIAIGFVIAAAIGFRIIWITML